MTSQESTGMLQFKLEMNKFHPAKYHSLVQRAKMQDIRFSLLSARLNDDKAYRRLYQIVKEGVLNSPQSDGKTFESYEQFCDNLLQPYYVDVADSYTVATFKDEWIGLAGIPVDSESLIGKCGLTVVCRGYQGKGIAKALKALSLEQAAKQGATIVVTSNHVNNAPMLAINRIFGFVPER